MNRMVYKIRTIIITLAISIMLFPFVSIFTNAITAGVGPRYEELIGKRDFKWPVPGWYGLSSCFIDSRVPPHHAIDIPANGGTPVYASYAGVVEYVRSVDNGGFGKYVVIRHENYELLSGEYVTLYSQYAHLSSVNVSVGDPVTTATVIGAVGNTGYSFGNHLDFQILYGGWSSYHTYSRDPYVNEFLELPQSIYCASTEGCCGVGPTGCCCFYYLEEVKKYMQYHKAIHLNARTTHVMQLSESKAFMKMVPGSGLSRVMKIPPERKASILLKAIIGFVNSKLARHMKLHASIKIRKEIIGMR